MKKQFLKNINGVLKKRSVGDLKFFNGSVDNKFLKNSSSETKPENIELQEEERQKISSFAGNVKNTGLQLKLIAFKAASLKREQTLLKQGGKKCSRCGAVINGKGNLCAVCSRYEQEKLHDELVKFLLTEPWSDYENCKKTLNCDKILYDSVKNNLRQHYYAKVADETASCREKMLVDIF